MKYLSLIVFLFLCGCQIGKDFKTIQKDAKQISGDIKKVRAALVPVDTLMMEATSGILTELASADSEEKLDSISARINRIIVQYLNESFKNLDPGPIGSKLTQGALDTLLAQENEKRIKALIAAVSLEAGNDFSAVINKLFRDLSSGKNKERLNSLLLSMFTSSSSDSLASFLNRAIAQVKLGPLGEEIATEVVADNLQPAIDSLVRASVRSIFQQIRHDSNAQGFFDNIKNIIFLALGLMGIILGFIFWWNRRKSMEINRLFVHAIENMEGHTGAEAKRVIEAQARDRGILKNVDQIMAKESQIGKKDLPGR